MDLTGERWKLGLLLHTHNEQKNRCTYNRCCTTNVSVMQRRFLFAAQVFVDDTQPILAAHWVYCRKMFLQPQQRLCLSHVIANHRLATAETLQSFACHCEPVGCCADTLPPSACHCEERGGCTATWQSVPLRQHKTESNTLGKSVTGCEFAPSAISSHHFLRGSGLPRRFAPRNDMQKLAACPRLQGRTTRQARNRLRIRPRCRLLFASSAGMRIATSLRSSQ